MIAIATHVNGRGIRHISRFKNRLDFLTYADQAIESAGFFISRRATYRHARTFAKETAQRLAAEIAA